MHVKATFPSGHITIELLQTPIVNKWIEVFNNWKKLNVPSVIEENGLLSHGQPWVKQNLYSEKFINARAEAVRKINNAIDNVNSLIEGEKFPYSAWEGMTWMQTNRLHRCFTNAAMKYDQNKMWHHNLTHEQLIKCKTLGSMDVTDYIYDNSPLTYKVLDLKKFMWEIEVINHQVHEYEGKMYSLAAEQIIEDLCKDGVPYQNRRKRIKFDERVTYTPDGTTRKKEYCSPDLLATVTYEELISSFPDNYEDYNVILHKSITGKCYEFCYQQYDDPLEADIRNIELVDGNMEIYYNNDHYKFSTNNRFYQWAKSYGLRDELFFKVPLGKIVDNTIDIETVCTDSAGMNYLAPVEVELL